MRLTFATYITLLRMLMIPFVAISILYGRYGWALTIFLISGLTDAVDGLIARKFKQKTRLGELLDPVADKLLLSTSFLLLTFAARLNVAIPLWVAIMVFARDIVILASAVAIALTTGFTKFTPSIFGKASTVIQVICVLVVLLVNHFEIEPAWLRWLFYLTFGATLFSGVHYIFFVSKRFMMEMEHSEPPRKS